MDKGTHFCSGKKVESISQVSAYKILLLSPYYVAQEGLQDIIWRQAEAVFQNMQKQVIR